MKNEEQPISGRGAPLYTSFRPLIVSIMRARFIQERLQETVLYTNQRGNALECHKTVLPFCFAKAAVSLGELL